LAETASKAAIEIHMENIIKGYQNLWLGYKGRVGKFYTLVKKEREPGLVSEDNSFIRFHCSSEQTGFNSLFFVYEIGKVFPTLMWRHLLGYTQGFNYVVLGKSLSCLPAFSFSLDQQTTLLYWGEDVPFLSTSDLRNLRLSNFVLKANNPASVIISAANLAWPKSAYPLINQELKRLATYYLFNSLLPPILNGRDEVWFEAPFILVGDRIVRFLTIHKTLCSVAQKTARAIRDRGVINAKATIIDRNFRAKHISIDIPEECFDEFIKKGPPYEVIFVKTMKVRCDPTMIEQRPYIRYTVYPFESIKLFGEESYGWLLTIASIVLREFYLMSSDPFFFTITPKEFQWCLAKILKSLPCGDIEQFALRLIETKEGLYLLASLLGVYVPEGSFLSYLHPALFECLPFSLKGQVGKDELVRFQRIASEYLAKAESLPRSYSNFLIQELFRREFGSPLDYTTANYLRTALHYLVRTFIPLSKDLCLGCEEVKMC